MEIRKSLEKDREAIKNLHLEAFSEEENEVVSKLSLDLISDSSRVLSLVALENGAPIGHVVFSPVSISDNSALSAYILAPLAVSPCYQKKGVGRTLISKGLQSLAGNAVEAVFVLGDPAYYSRSGFHTAHQVQAPYPLHYPEAWQAIELKGSALQGISGKLECIPALMSPELW